jgi:hypothetical protein
MKRKKKTKKGTSTGRPAQSADRDTGAEGGEEKEQGKAKVGTGRASEGNESPSAGD